MDQVDYEGMEVKEYTEEEMYDFLGYKVEGDKVIDRDGRVWYRRKHTNPVKAIRYACLECMGTDRRDETMNPKTARVDIMKCTDPLCPLYSFRFGKNPFRKEMSEERKEAMRERLKAKPIRPHAS